MPINLVVFDVEYWLMSHFAGVTQLCILYSMIFQNLNKQKSLLYFKLKQFSQNVLIRHLMTHL